MRIHTNTLEWRQIIDALSTEKARGRIGASVSLDNVETHGSRSHRVSFEIILVAYDEHDSSRKARARRNSGYYGADRNDYAATHDEWGWFLAKLYRQDPAMIVGTMKHPVYESANDFHHVTALSYHPVRLIHELTEEDGDPYPYVSGRHGANFGFLDGYRVNHNRDPFNDRTGQKFEPRTVEQAQRRLAPVLA